MIEGTARTGLTALTVCDAVHFDRRAHGRKRLAPGPLPDPPAAEDGSLPRVTRLLALAHHLKDLLDAGEVTDIAELARLGRVSRARMTQIMDLLLLAPDLQEEILFLPRTRVGRDAVTERTLRSVVREASWSKQRALWRSRSSGSIEESDPLA